MKFRSSALLTASLADEHLAVHSMSLKRKLQLLERYRYHYYHYYYHYIGIFAAIIIITD